MLLVGFLGSGGGGGITQLTQDALAGPGSGSVPSTVVQAQAGKFLFGTDGTFQSTFPANTTGPFRLGPAFETGGVAFYTDTNATTQTTTNHSLYFGAALTNPRTVVNGPGVSNALVDITINGVQNIEVEGGTGNAPGISLGQAAYHVTLFQGSSTGSGVPFAHPNTLTLANAANTIVKTNAAMSGIGQLYAKFSNVLATDIGPSGLVYVGAPTSVNTGSGAATSCAPNGIGQIDTQAGVGILERFYITTVGATPGVVTYPIPLAPGLGNCVFIGKVYVLGRLNSAGAGGGTPGDQYSICYNIQGKNLNGTVTVTVTPDASFPLKADTSMLSNTFGITTSTVSSQGNLVFTATGVLAGGQGTIDWQWDLDPLKVC